MKRFHVLAVGSGSFLGSLISVLGKSGVHDFRMLNTESLQMDRERLLEAVEGSDAVLYAAPDGNIDELRLVQAVCKESGKLFLPGIFIGGVGMAGPLIHAHEKDRWESAWRRIHLPVVYRNPVSPLSSIHEELLANVMAAEWANTVSGNLEAQTQSRVYLLPLDTLEGSWHFLEAHPLVTGDFQACWAADGAAALVKEHESGPKDWFSAFERLSNRAFGMYHLLEEGDLLQLPLARCRVQVTDPLSEGPASLLPERICSGLTHEEALREAGLIGMEDYVGRMLPLFVRELSPVEHIDPIDADEFIGVGAGFTKEEAVYRGIVKGLDHALDQHLAEERPVVKQVSLTAVNDRQVQFYLRALTLLQGEVLAGLERETLYGFPIVWIGTKDVWVPGTGIHSTYALRRVLQKALEQQQGRGRGAVSSDGTAGAPLRPEGDRKHMLRVPRKQAEPWRDLQTALQILQHNGYHLDVFEMTMEPPVRKDEFKVFGVLLRKGEKA